ncbi:MAG: carboxylate-amine ligase [Candidatus Didemnitutus sp.]|nr:carboxylate-amine ligase [Candidatus Didemnitutus sp.]
MCAAKPKHQFTLGIEEEFQIVDPVTRELKSHIEEIIEGGKIILKERVRPELHQSVVEVGTDICQDIGDARKSVTGLRTDLARLARQSELRIAAAGTHPFSHWHDQKISIGERHQGVLNDLQQVARANLIFGLHVHLGMPDRETAIHLQNTARYFLPHIFALSTNSPFWVGRNTGYASYRLQVFQRFPRTGIPDLFESVNEFDDYVNLLVKTGCIDNAKKIWWDIRLHPIFHTLEFRICDIPMRVDETICLAAIMQAVTAKLYKLHRKNMSFRTYRARLINENRWRAARYGINGKMIDFGSQEEVSTRSLIAELLEFIDDVVDELGSRAEVDYVHTILRNGTGADRQVEVYNRTQDLKAVVDYTISETHHGLDL